MSGAGRSTPPPSAYANVPPEIDTPELFDECSPPSSPCANSAIPSAFSVTRGPTRNVVVLGTLEFAQGKHEKALQAFRAAQRVAPKAALPRAHCGEALLFLGKKAEAEKELEAALKLDPDGDGGRLAQALMDAVEAGALPPKKAAKSKK